MASSASEQSNPASVSAELSPQPLPTRSFKNDLIDFALRSKMTVPEFHTRNEGPSHAPAFRSRVFVNGFIFISPNTFARRKAAEQEVSKIALELLTNKLIEEVQSLVSKSVTFCKCTFNEYAIKMYLKLPTYNTVEYKSVIPYFVSTVDVNGSKYTGEAAARKKDAEDLAARSAILSSIGNSNSGITLVQMLKKKAALFDSGKPRIVEHLSDRVIVLPVKDIAESQRHLQVVDDKDKDIVDAVATHNMNQIEIVRPEPRPIISTIQQHVMPIHEPTPQPVAAHHVDNVITSKKRRRNNYKANKRARLAAAAAELNGLLSNLGSPCATQ